ncbi:MAG: hypothetical protein WBW48_10860 [Anaerolineae bacterium]
MKNRVVVIVLVGVIVLALFWTVDSTVAGPPKEGPAGEGEVRITGTVASKISYQGRLTDALGNPLNGNYNLVFQLWDDATTGSQVGGDIVRNNVPVSNGLFTVDLDVLQDAFNGQALWLRIQVNGQWLSPRQELLPVPYALSLRPQARIEGESTGTYFYDAVLNVKNYDTSAGRRAIHGVSGSTVGGYPNEEVGVQGEAANGYGVAGHSSDSSGVYGFSRYADGVFGTGGLTGVSGYTTNNNATGVLGTATGYDGKGVEGDAQFGTGVVGSGETGVKGTSSVYAGIVAEGPTGLVARGSAGDGVSAESQGGSDSAAIRGAANGDGWGGYFTSANGPGLFAEGYEGVHGQATSGSAPGVHGVGFIGVHGESLFGYTGYGVQGDGGLGGVKGTSTAGNGVEGRSESGAGVLGVSTSSEGVVGNSVSGVGVYANTGYGEAAVKGEGPKGVYGKGSADGGEGVLGEGTGLYTEGVLGSSAYAHGVGGYSSGTNGSLAIGVYGQTAATWGLATNQNLFVGGSCTGCTVVFVALNGDANPLEVGDVVSISGIAPPLKGQQTPILRVRRATAASGGALGVVQARAAATATETPVLGGDSDQTVTVEMPGLAPGNVAPGDYLFVVIQGLVQVRADASSGAIEVGDLVGPAALPSPSGRGAGGEGGLVQKLTSVTPAAPVLGRALEPLAKGTGLIWVLVLG